ncbi:aminotransferase class V-fold PLP-dependent enzyme [Pseudoalteromonas sp. G4]|uniref:aminotransferase class V-fold PLP-dependent enzyme n=1 Tax=Pseudoalteromonas sp. G4 TaxID=2992761 RepID=UPI00237DB87C|nr:aminotransferase class V-fold PLP-dependent enzyme [Pseudoalteromonas sp. G4]MDE3272145.1 aminotransferase class V-fold PLP-dependent enzyme [Pseudoalteromonas sp. G4]
MSQSLIYLDANATTPVYSDIAKEVMHCMEVEFGNPSSSHITGLKAKRLMEDTRNLGKKLIGTEKGRLLFTSGATEGIQTSVVSALIAAKSHNIEKPVLLYGATEHKAVPNTLKHWNELLEINAEVIAIPVDSKGILDHDFIAQHIENALMICTMIVNNETGATQDIAALDKVIRDNNPNVFWMVDCVQGLGKQALNLDKTSINYAPFSGHKLYAPKGIGFLYLSENAPLTPFIAGGGQESGARSGTENLPGIAGLKKLFELMLDNTNNVFKPLETLKRYRADLAEALSYTFDEIVFNNDFDVSVPTTLNFSVANIAGSEVMNLFDAASIRVSAGSACSSGAASSFVLDAMNLAPWQSENAIRLSFGPMATEQEINNACERIRSLKDKLANACMLFERSKETPCAVGVNQYVLNNEIMYVIVNESLNALLINAKTSELGKIERLIKNQGLRVTGLVNVDTDVAAIFANAKQYDLKHDAHLLDFGVEINQGMLYKHSNNQRIEMPLQFLPCETITEINSASLKQALVAEQVDGIVDIRENYEHQEGELGDFLNIPSDMISNIPSHRLFNEMIEGRLAQSKRYVLVCRSGRRSKACCALLNEFGFTNLTNLAGGVAFI